MNIYTFIYYIYILGEVSVFLSCFIIIIKK